MSSQRRFAKRWAGKSPRSKGPAELPPTPRDTNGVPPATPRRYATGVAFQLFGRGGQALVALVVMAFLSRTLGLEALGIFATWEALFTFFDILVDAGSGAALVRRACAHPSSTKSLFRRALRYRKRSLAVTVLVALLLAALDPRVSASSIWIWLSIASLASHLWGLYGCLFQLQLDFRAPAATRTGAALAGLGFVFLLHSCGIKDPLAYIAALSLGRALGNAGLRWCARSLFPSEQTFAEDSQQLTGFEREALHLGCGWVIREAYGRLDILALRLLSGPAAAGLYAPIRKTFTVACQIPAMFANVALPAFASIQDPAAFAEKLRSLSLKLTLVAVVTASLSWPLTATYLGLLFDVRFLPGADALRILAGAAVCVFPGTVLMTALIARGGATKALIVSLFALVTAGIATALLVPHYGIEGAAIARLVTEFAILLLAAAGLRFRP
ncbi:MAG: oligosaccharide flippase family protein [Planctomycetes bacterium]|nr:oligosaccharide flippase family protein [Planctomycetota bacterium]